jgi:integral membrane protein
MFTITLFRWSARLEGISYLLLLVVAMPLKYIWQFPLAVQIVGMGHGVLFISYIALIPSVRKRCNWTSKATLCAAVASLLPGATFLVERKLLPE